MSSKIVRVQGGDYKLIVGAAGQPGYITLDTNPVGTVGTQGKVTITGDLEVLGNTTTVQSETLEVKDNIIYLNVGGGSSTGISGTLGGIAGFDIDRSNPAGGTSLPDVSLYWDENIPSEDPVGTVVLGGSGNNGAFVFKDTDDNLRALATNSLMTYYSDSDFGGLVVDVGSGDNGVIRVVGDGGSPYQDRIINYSLLSTLYQISTVARSSNIATVTTTTPHGLTTSSKVTVFCGTKASFNATVVAVLSTPTSDTFTYDNTGPVVTAGPLGSETGTVRPYAIIDDNNIPNMRAVVDYADRALLGVSFNRILENDTKVQTYDYETSGVSKITFEIDGGQRAIINSNGLTVDNVRIRNNNISNTAVDNIYIDNVLGLANKAGAPPAVASGYVKLYSKNSPGTGGTGLFFVNTEGTNDELISKTKALLYSLIL
jgi:hypothetical protein